jgi:hypothetical protein
MRNRVTESHRAADTYFILSRADRALSDSALHNELQQILEMARDGANDVYLLLTRIDVSLLCSPTDTPRLTLHMQDMKSDTQHIRKVLRETNPDASKCDGHGRD